MPRRHAGRATHVKRDMNGVTTHVKFQNREKCTPVSQVLNMIRDGLTTGLRINQTENGTEYPQGVPDGIERNNLDELPTWPPRRQNR